MRPVQPVSKGFIFAAKISLAITFIPLSSGIAFSAPPVNTIQDGRIIPGGSYYNTPGGKTTFTNSGKGGLWVRPGVTVRGLEVSPANQLTNHGGTLHFYAPGSVVRVDGNIDVNAVRNGNGAFLGNGGKVFIDSAYLFQKGNIFANGNNGGLVQINVGGMTMGSGATIQAKGMSGNGGVVAINSNGPVDIQKGALIDTSGHVSGNFDTNIINIEGSLVNVEGILRADGFSPLSRRGSRGGVIRLVATGQTDLAEIGQIVSSGEERSSYDSAVPPTIDAATAQALASRNGVLSGKWDGTVRIGPQVTDSSGKPVGGIISANGANGLAAGNNDASGHNGASAGDGGSITLASRNDANIAGVLQVNGGSGIASPSPLHGGNGGTIALLVNRDVHVTGKLQANGGLGAKSTGTPTSGRSSQGGQGGLIAFSYDAQMINRGVISANGGQGGEGGKTLLPLPGLGNGGQGGQGGLVVFSGNNNPVGLGKVETIGGKGGARGKLQVKELPPIPFGMVGKGGKAGVIVAPNPATFQSGQQAFQVDGATGRRIPVSQMTRENELLTHADSLILLSRNVAQGSRFGRLDERLADAQSGMRSVTDPLGQGAARQEFESIMSPESVYSYHHFLIGSSADQLGLFLRRPFTFDDAGLGAGPQLRTLTIANDGAIDVPEFWRASGQAGGRISMLAAGDISNGEDGLDVLGQSSAGSINLASQGSIGNFTLLTTSTATGGLHGGSLMMSADNDIQNFSGRLIQANSGLIGGTQRYRAGHDFINTGVIRSNATSTSSNSLATGGSIYIKAGNLLQNGAEDPFDFSSLESKAEGGTWGQGGFVQLKANRIQIVPETIHVNGSFKNGSMIIEEENL